MRLKRVGTWLSLASIAIPAALVACSSSDHAPPGILEAPDSGVGGSTLPQGGGGVADASADSDAAELGGDGSLPDGAGGATDGALPDSAPPDGAAGSATGGAAGDGGPPTDSGTGGGLVGPPSCKPGADTVSCGLYPETCCRSLSVPGNTYYRSYDGVNANYLYQSYPASVTGFQLDKYEITVNRFRQFVSAVVAGYRPAAGSGKHDHLRSGQGLVSATAAGTYETGWDEAWNASLPTTADAWTTALGCGDAPTWTAAKGANEKLPINCTTWYETYAFCIWDGGFLPSEAEWNGAASGGADQRVYPWSVPANSTTIDCEHANYLGATSGTDFCVSPGIGATNAVGSEEAKGAGKWGHTDLAGNVFEWNLDWYADYPVGSCPDCAQLNAASYRVIRGGAFGNTADALLASARNASPAASRSDSLGGRCARKP